MPFTNSDGCLEEQTERIALKRCGDYQVRGREHGVKQGASGIRANKRVNVVRISEMYWSRGRSSQILEICSCSYQVSESVDMENALSIDCSSKHCLRLTFEDREFSTSLDTREDGNNKIECYRNRRRSIKANHQQIDRRVDSLSNDGGRHLRNSLRQLDPDEDS